MADKQPEKPPDPWANLSGRDRKKARQQYFAERSAQRSAGDQSQQQAGGSGSANQQQPAAPSGRARKTATSKRRDQPSGSGGVTPRFTPGAFPPIIQGGGNPTFPVAIVPDIGVFDGHMEAILQTVALGPLFIQFTHELRAAQLAPQGFTVREFAVLGRAIASLSLAQQVFFAAENTGETVPHVPALRNMHAQILRSMTVVIGQYGALPIAPSGIRLRLESTQAVVHALVRHASYLTPVVGEAFPADEAILGSRRRWWLPTRRHCPMFIHVLTVRLLAMCEGLGVNPGYERLHGALFPGQHREPQWWNAIARLIPQGQRPDWAFLWEPFPAAIDFVALFTENIRGPRRLERLGLEWPDPAEAHLGWNLQLPNAISATARRWQDWVPIVNRYFYLATVRDSSSTAMGSATQLSELATPADNVYIFRAFLGLQSTAASLAVAFHPTTLWDAYRHHPCVTNTATVLVEQERARWVQSDIRPTPAPTGEVAPQLGGLHV